MITVMWCQLTRNTENGMKNGLLIQNATMVLPNRVVEGDLRVANGIIKTIAPLEGLQPELGELVIDGTGSVSYTHLTLPTNREV